MNGQDGTAIFHVGDLAKRLEISEGHLESSAGGRDEPQGTPKHRLLAHALLPQGKASLKQPWPANTTT